ncbi:MAG: hypothetical protein FK731_13905, partial [Asgard group archaeon]|nr:hypothetical protein [Asgard group archaeon]
MDMCSLETHENFSEMRNKAIKSNDGKTIGYITDVVFDNDLNIHSFILGGRLWNRIRKRLGFINDVEHTLTADKIYEITKNNIRLLISRKQLKDTIQEGAISSSASTYTSLRRKTVVDLDKKLVGKIINMVFLPCGEAAFIVSCLEPDTVG